jgi:hypothetical protein
MPQSEGARIPAAGLYSPDGQKAMPQLEMFPDRL